MGILVDDATVEIENNHRQLDLGKPLRQAILDGAAEVGDARVRRDPLDLHRVRADHVPRRGGRVPVLAAGDVRRLRDARQLPPLADARSDDGPVPAGGRGARAARPAMPTRAPSRRSRRPDLRLASRRASSGSTDAYEGALDWVLTHASAAIAVFLAFAIVVAVRCTRSSAETSSRPSMRGSSGSTSGLRRGRGSSRPKSTSSRSRTISAR